MPEFPKSPGPPYRGIEQCPLSGVVGTQGGPNATSNQGAPRFLAAERSGTAGKGGGGGEASERDGGIDLRLKPLCQAGAPVEECAEAALEEGPWRCSTGSCSTDVYM